MEGHSAGNNLPQLPGEFHNHQNQNLFRLPAMPSLSTSNQTLTPPSDSHDACRSERVLLVILVVCSNRLGYGLC
jgi:hypothetical protein